LGASIGFIAKTFASCYSHYNNIAWGSIYQSIEKNTGQKKND
jgi:hypothetical protein